jgi:bifunctional non-homologous end joining protein LigD
VSLAQYKKKRKFSQTPEPRAEKKQTKTKALRFVVQRHKASHLHYDFRLEAEGVLKSWAVPKGPSMNPEDKRLAMMVEDHPFSYRTFKGIIPEGNYGAGIVEIWDEGFYLPYTEDAGISDDSDALTVSSIKKGNLKIVLQGKKLKGTFALVKTKAAPNSWLLIKHNDEYAVHKPYSSEEQTPKNSPINKYLAKKAKGATAGKRK